MLNFIQSQKQTLKIAPSQIRLLNFYQLNAIELENFIKDELNENFLLEEVKKEEDWLGDSTQSDKNVANDFVEWDDYAENDNYEIKNYITSAAASDFSYASLLTEPSDWRAELKEQFQLILHEETNKNLAYYIVDSLTDDGYLTSTIEEIANDASFAMNLYIEEENVASLVELLRNMEPIGIGAKDLKDCLLLQATNLKNDLLGCLIEKHFDELATHNYEKIMESLSLKPTEMNVLLDNLAMLKPFPVNAETQTSVAAKQTIIPDYFIYAENNSMVFSLNNGYMPSVQINQSYLNGIGTKDKEHPYIKEKMAGANWLLAAIEQREQTMAKIIRVIGENQKDFFLTGDFKSLKPMILKDIAVEIGMDISTVSRLTSGKYVQTSFGIIHLKDLFTEAIRTHEGKEVSNKRIQIELSEIIANENKQNPLNDFQLAQLLSEKGYALARRTVAKYREMLKIPSAQLRKTI